MIAFAMPRLIQFAAASNEYTHPDRHLSDYTIGLLWAALLGGSIFAWPVRRSMKLPLLWAWLFRVFVTLFISLSYFHHYPSLDGYEYFAARTTFPDLQQIGFQNGTENILAPVWLLHKLVPDSFHAMNVTFAMLSLLGICWFWMASEAFLGYPSRALFFLLMLDPSLTFWTAGLGKEAAMMFGVGLYTYAVVAWRRTGRSVFLVEAAAGLLIASLIRSWMAAILVGPLIVLVYSWERGFISRFVTTALLVAAVGAALPFILHTFYLEAAQDITEQAASISSRFNLGDSAGAAFALSSPMDLVKYAPSGMFSALFRPLPGDVMNSFGLMASLENLLIVGLFLRVLKRVNWCDFKDPIIDWATGIVFSGLLSTRSYRAKTLGRQ